MLTNLKRFFFAGEGTQSALGDLGLLAIRLGYGVYMAFGHGMGKFPISEKFVGGLTAMGVPMPGVMAYLAAGSELIGGILFALGLLTRPAATALFVTMLVAISTAHKNDPWASMGGPSKEGAMMYLIAAVGILLTGAGRFSLDALINRDKSAA